jgi:hypothetical protein
VRGTATSHRARNSLDTDACLPSASFPPPAAIMPAPRPAPAPPLQAAAAGCFPSRGGRPPPRHARITVTARHRTGHGPVQAGRSMIHLLLRLAGRPAGRYESEACVQPNPGLEPRQAASDAHRDRSPPAPVRGQGSRSWSLRRDLAAKRNRPYL